MADPPPLRPIPPIMATFPKSFLEFGEMFPDEASCIAYLELVRWPNGFICPSCGSDRLPYLFRNRPTVRRCRSCMHDTSLTSNTVMHQSKVPLRTWFLAAYLIATHPRGYSARQLGFHLGRKDNDDLAYLLFHKLRAASAVDKREKLGLIYPVEIDETYIGGKTRGKGRGVTDATLVIAAVEARIRFNPKAKKIAPYVGMVRFKIIDSRGRNELEAFIIKNVAKGALIRTDGWQGYSGLTKLGYVHEPLVVKGDPELLDAHLPLVHRVFSEFKTTGRGTHTHISPQHLQAYLNERSFRFNHRFDPMETFARLLSMSVATRGPTEKGLTSGTWVHPNPGNGGKE